MLLKRCLCIVLKIGMPLFVCLQMIVAQVQKLNHSNCLNDSDIQSKNSPSFGLKDVLLLEKGERLLAYLTRRRLQKNKNKTIDN